MQRDQPFEIVRKLRAMRWLALGEGVARQPMRVPQVVHGRQHRPEDAPIVGHAAHRHAAEVHAVIAALAPDEARPLTLAARPVIGERDLERGLHCL